MKQIVLGIVAHVDAGKTTLSEAILYESGVIRKLGRVDHGDAFFDTNELERSRGITIFSKQAVFPLGEMQVTFLDTPGHVDFSAEMERTLQVLDYAVLVINGADGVQGHTRTLWQLLERYHIPVFLFINKMDQPGTDRKELLKQLKACLGDGCIDFADQTSEEFLEQAAMSDEQALEHYLEQGNLEREELIRLIRQRKLFPCFFGSALRLTGVKELLKGLEYYTETPVYPKQFGARVFKIARDGQGNRLTYLKITGGSLNVKDFLPEQQEKVNQIRIYSGEKYQLTDEAVSGCVCAVTGLGKTYAGQGLGIETWEQLSCLEPVLACRMILPEGCDARTVLPKLQQLEEEDPKLHIMWDESLKEIRVQIMGAVQIEVLTALIQERFGLTVVFGESSILYKETISTTVEGIGHFEPLRHYAEVHLLLEPGERGSGMQFETNCSEEMLDKNWQRLVLTHLKEREHKGVLTGSPVTDMRITLVAGRAHQKHTEGGDFRQATYRALRQGLRQAVSVLLEPYYAFRLEVPMNVVGRAMADLEKMQATFQPPDTENGMAVLEGSVPVSEIGGYQQEVAAYTRGHGRLQFRLKGYEPCHNAEEIISHIAYQPDQDLENPSGSVFCSHGAGFVVDWDQVETYMHVERQLVCVQEETKTPDPKGRGQKHTEELWLGTEEIDAILEKAHFSNRRKEPLARKRVSPLPQQQPSTAFVKGKSREQKGKEYLLVDGYNVIFAWKELSELAGLNIDSARSRLLDILCNYQGIRNCCLITVFDAYRVKGHTTEVLDYHNIHVVYTKEAETADQYIEKFAHEHGKKDKVTVVTSDSLEQVIIRGQGCELLSAREFEKEILRMSEEIRREYLNQSVGEKRYLLDSLTEHTAKQVKEIGERKKKEDEKHRGRENR